MHRLYVLSLVIVLAGCNDRYYRWGSRQFEQACVREDHCKDIASLVRSADRYDGFNTVGHFDALWYSPQAMDWFLEEYAQRSGGVTSEAYRKLEKQLEKDRNNHIVLYLLMPDDTNGSLQPHMALNEGGLSKWSVMLDIDGTYHQPLKIEKIRHVVPEIRASFGKRFDEHYRICYRVTFLRVTEEGDDILSHADCMKCILRSPQYEIAMSWTLPQGSSPCQGVAC